MADQQSGGDNEGLREAVEGRGEEGRDHAKATPPIGEQPNPEQTQTDAPDDDVGVPPEEEMNRPAG